MNEPILGVVFFLAVLVLFVAGTSYFVLIIPRLTKSKWERKLRLWFESRGAAELYDFADIYKFNNSGANFKVKPPHNNVFDAIIFPDMSVAGDYRLEDFITRRQMESWDLFQRGLSDEMLIDLFVLLNSRNFDWLTLGTIVGFEWYKPMKIREKIYFAQGVKPEILRLLWLAKVVSRETVIKDCEQIMRNRALPRSRR